LKASVAAIGPRHSKRASAGFVILCGEVNLVITGSHVVIYTKDAEADRTFFRDVLGFRSVDAGHGWLIFALPPSEVAFHPTGQHDAHELYLLCDDLKHEMDSLQACGVHCSTITEERWGSITRLTLPGGSQLGLYQPKHPTAIAKE
jgi:hypothetical protein